jgi:hypothetical protein
MTEGLYGNRNHNEMIVAFTGSMPPFVQGTVVLNSTKHKCLGFASAKNSEVNYNFQFVLISIILNVSY